MGKKLFETAKELKDPKIKTYVTDCINTLKNSDLFCSDWGNDIEVYSNDSLHTFGSMDLTNRKDPKPFKLTLSSYLLDENEDVIKNTIYHELCHYIQMKQQIEKGVIWYDRKTGKALIKRKDKSSGFESIHGDRWKRIARKVSALTGLNITSTGKMEEHPHIQKEIDNKIKYIIRCENCGQEFKYMRRTDFVKTVQSGINEQDWHCNCGSRKFELIKGPKDE